MLLPRLKFVPKFQPNVREWLFHLLLVVLLLWVEVWQFEAVLQWWVVVVVVVVVVVNLQVVMGLMVAVGAVVQADRFVE